MTYRLSMAAIVLMGLAACQPASETEATTQPQAESVETEVEEGTEETSLLSERLTIAEGMIDAFYSFDPDQLRPFLADAEDSSDRLLFYQGWAEGGNYKIMSRAPCAPDEIPNQFSCPITVEDDAVLALKSDFKVTDTFTLTFEGTTIEKVETSSNDQPVYYQAYQWVTENLPEVMEGPCQGFFADGPTPGDCARAMADGYAQFAESDAFPQ